MNITEELLDELRDVQLIDNTLKEASLAWAEIESSVLRFIPKLEREKSFLVARVKYLESEIDRMSEERYPEIVPDPELRTSEAEDYSNGY